MTLRHILQGLAALAATCCLQAPLLASQTPADRADPSVVEEELADPPLPDQSLGDPLSIEAEDTPQVGIPGALVVGAIRVDGAGELPASAFAPVISSYIGRSLSTADLRALATDVANVARDAGFGLATAWIPAQQISSGILSVRLDLGRIDAIEAEGSAGGVARRLLAPLVNGRPVPTVELERRLLLAGDLAGIWVGDARLERRDGRNILHVRTRRDRVRPRAYLDNWGSSAIGPVKASFIVDVNGVLADDDQITLGTVATPLDPGEFQLVRAGYSKALGLEGTVVSVEGYAAWSHPGGTLSGEDIDGASYEGSLGVVHPLIRSRAISLWGNVEFALRDSTQTQSDRVIRDDRLATATASVFGAAELGDGRARGLLAVVQGTGAFDATREGDPDASRPDAGAVFTKLEFWAQYRRPLTADFSLQLEAQGQIASRPLLSSEEMGLGGRSFLRSYDYREASGDKGIAGSVELRFDLDGLPSPVDAAQLYGYADAGSVGNYRDGTGGATLASAGGGARIWFGDFGAELELGIPLNDSPFSRGDSDPRLSFSLSARF